MMMEKSNNNEVRLNKIPLKLFIDALIDVYTSGAEYVDLIGTLNEEQDSIGISVSIDYMTVSKNEYYKELSERMLEKAKDKKLSEEDLNDLT